MCRYDIAMLLAIHAFMVNSCGLTTAESCEESPESLNSADCMANPPASTSPAAADPSVQDLAPAVGAGPSFSPLNLSGFTVSWGAATDSITKAEDLHYKLVYAASIADLDSLEKANAVSGLQIELEWSKNTLSTQVSGLTQATARAYAVLVRDEVGNISLYPAQTVTALNVLAPSIGSALAFSAVTLSGFTVSWGAAASELNAASDLEYRGVWATSSAEIDTIAEVEAIADSQVMFDWSKNLLSFTMSGFGRGIRSAVAIQVRDERGVISLYSPSLVTTLRYRLIYKTPTLIFPTQLSPTAAADAICNAQKQSDRGTFKAMIVAQDRVACISPDCVTNGALEHIDWVMAPLTTYENADGAVLWTTNAAGIVPGNPSHPAIYPASGNGIPVWTGISSGWLASSDSCVNWTSSLSTDNGFAGVANYTDAAAWTLLTLPCNQTRSIYCVEQLP